MSVVAGIEDPDATSPHLDPADAPEDASDLDEGDLRSLVAEGLQQILAGARRSSPLADSCTQMLRQLEDQRRSSHDEPGEDDATAYFPVLHLACHKDQPVAVQTAALSLLQKLLARNSLDLPRLMDPGLYPLPGDIRLDPVPPSHPFAFRAPAKPSALPPAADHLPPGEKAEEKVASDGSLPEDDKPFSPEDLSSAAGQALEQPVDAPEQMPEGPEVDSQPEPEAQPGPEPELLPHGRALVHVLVQMLYDCSMREAESVRLLVINCVLTAVSAPSCVAHEQTLLMCVRTCFQVFLLARDPVNRATAKAALTQILSLTQQRMEAAQAELQRVTLALEAGSRPGVRKSESDSDSDSGSDPSLEGVDGVAEPVSGPAAQTMTPLRHADLRAPMAAAHSPGPSVPPSPARPSPAPSGHGDSPSLSSSPGPAGAPEPESSRGGRGKYGSCAVCRRPAEHYCLHTRDPVCSKDCKQTHIRRLFGASPVLSAGPAPGDGRSPAELAAHANLFQQDLLVLLKALCRLSSKGAQPGDAPGSVQVRTKVLSLELLLGVLEKTGPALRSGPSFIALIQHSLVMGLLINAAAPVESIFRLSSALFVEIVTHFKAHLRNEIGVILDSIFLRILSSSNSSLSHKLTTLMVFSRFCQDPQTIVDIFVNYDCEFDSFNIFASMMTQLEKVAQGRFSNDNLLSPEQQASLQQLALQTIVSILRSLVVWTRRARRLQAEELGTGGPGSELGLVDADRLLDEEAADQTAVDKVLGHVSRAGRADSTSPRLPSAASAHRPSSSGTAAATTTAATTNNSGSKQAMGYAEKKDRKQRLELGIDKFAIKASKGLKYLWNESLLERTPEAIARFFLHTPGLNKRQIGDYMGEDLTFNKEVMYRYVELHSFPGLSIDEAIRTFLQGFRLPGEAQKIDRMMEKFAEQYCQDNPGVFSNADTAYVLAYSIIMLNTDAHNPMVKRKMTLEQFLSQNRGIDDGKDLPREFLTDIYFRIVENEIRLNDEHPAGAPATTDRSGPAEGFRSGGVTVTGAPGLLTGQQRDALFERERAEMVQRSKRMISRPESAAGGPAAAAGVSGIDALLGDDRLSFYHVTHADFEAVQPMYELVWPAALATFGQLMTSVSNTAGGGLSLSALLSNPVTALVAYPHHSKESSLLGALRKARSPSPPQPNSPVDGSAAQQNPLMWSAAADGGSGSPGSAEVGDEASAEEAAGDSDADAEAQGDARRGLGLALHRRRGGLQIAGSVLAGAEDSLVSAHPANADQLRLISLCLDGYRYAIRLASVFELDTPRVAFVNSLTTLTLLVPPHLAPAQPQGQRSSPAPSQEDLGHRYMGIKNVAAFKMLLKIVYTEGNQLRESWTRVFQCLTEYQRLAHETRDSPGDQPSQAPAAAASAASATAAASAVRPGFFGLFSGGAAVDSAPAASPTPAAPHPGPAELRPAEAANALLLQHAIDPVWVETVFTMSSNLNSEAIVDFVDSLRLVSEQELASAEQPRVFCLQKLVEVTSYNMADRIRLVWSRIWSLLSPYFVKAGCHPNLHVSMYACDSLRQLAMKFLEKDELTHYQFQKQFLQPFEEIMRLNSVTRVRELIVAMAEQLIHSRFDKLNSGWRSLFVVLSEAARDPSPTLVKSAFDLLVRLLESYFDRITANSQIDQCINCLVAFGCHAPIAADPAAGPEPGASAEEAGGHDIPLRAIGMLLKCTEWLAAASAQRLQAARSALGEAAEAKAAGPSPGTAGNQPPSPPEEDHLRVWFLLLTGLSRMVGDPRLAVRNRALQALFRTLHRHGNLFGRDTWGFIFRGVLFPMFDDVQHTHGDAPAAAARPRRVSQHGGRPMMDRRLSTSQSRAEDPEEEPNWLQSTCFVALSTLVQLFVEFFAQVRFLLPELLELLNSCIDSPSSLALSRIGVQCWAHLMHSLGGVAGPPAEQPERAGAAAPAPVCRPEPEDWLAVLEAFRRVVAQTLPLALVRGLPAPGWIAGLPRVLEELFADSARLQPPELERITARLGAAAELQEHLSPGVIVAQCKIQLMLLDAAQVFPRIWVCAREQEQPAAGPRVEHVAHLLATLGVSVAFAREFNAAADYRRQLWESGFMKSRQQTPPELFYQEACGVHQCLRLLMALHSSWPSLFDAAADQPLRTAAASLFGSLLGQYLGQRHLQHQHQQHAEADVADPRSVSQAAVEVEGRLRCLERPVLSLLRSLVGEGPLASEGFLRLYLPRLYPQLVRLISEGTPAVRAEVQQFFAAGLPQLLPWLGNAAPPQPQQ